MEFSKEQNDNKEVAFVFRKDLTDRRIFTGSDDELYFGSALSGMGEDMIVLHNHPRNSSFSDVDISLFKNLKLLKTLTIVKNNGKVEFITKGKNFNDEIFKLEYNRLKNKMIKNNTNIEYEKFINKLLNKTKSGVVWSEKDILWRWFDNKKILNSIGCDELSEEEKERSMSSEFDYLEED